MVEAGDLSSISGDPGNLPRQIQGQRICRGGCGEAFGKGHNWDAVDAVDAGSDSARNETRMFFPERGGKYGKFILLRVDSSPYSEFGFQIDIVEEIR